MLKRNNYDRIAAIYAKKFKNELDHKPLDREWLDLLIKRVGTLGPICDLGCGPGLLAERLLDRDVLYHGVDISEEFIADCQERHAERENVCFERGDIGAIELRENHYDVVAISNVLYLPGLDPAKIIKNAHRALRESGRIIVSGPTGPHSFERAQPLMRAQLESDGLLETQQQKADFDTVCDTNARLLPSEGNYWSIEGMIQLLKTLGFNGPVSASSEIYYRHGFLIAIDK